MSLIKSHTAHAAAPRWHPDALANRLPSAPAPPDPAAEEERAALLAQLAALTAERDLCASRAKDLEAEMVEAVAQAQATGREAGRLEAVSRADEALRHLARSLESGVAQLAADAAALETLAVQIVRVALSKMFAEPAEPALLVEAAIRRQLQSVEAEMLLRVEVSATDFPDPERLARLAREVGRGRVQVLASQVLASGDCRLKLKLGEVEIGLPQQWRRLSAVLDRHVESLADAR